MNGFQTSEVTRLRRQITLEYQAAKNVFVGFTPSARHDFITKRQENIGKYFTDLKKSHEWGRGVYPALASRERGVPPPIIRRRVMTEFEEYLALYEIDPIRLSIEAKVRYLTVHNAKRGKPIAPSNAEKIKSAVERLTGVPYTGSFVLMDDMTPPFKKIPGNYHWGEMQ